MLIETYEPARKRNSVQSSRGTLVQKASEVLPRNSTQISIVCIRCGDHMLPGAIALILTKLLLGAEDVGRVGKLIQKTPSQECFRWPPSSSSSLPLLLSVSPLGAREAAAA